MRLRSLLVLLTCLGATVVESTLPLLVPASLYSLRADLLLAVVLYLAMHDDIVQGSALSLLAGIFSDLGSATPVGIYAFLAVFTFVVVRMAASAVRADGGLQAAALAMVVSLVHAVLAAALFRVLVPGQTSLNLHASWLGSAVATGVGAIPVFALLRRIDAGLLPAGEGLGARARRGG